MSGSPSGKTTIQQQALASLLSETGSAIRHYGVVFLDILSQVDDEGVVYYKQAKSSGRLGVSRAFMHKAVHALIEKGYMTQLESKTKALKLKITEGLLNGTAA